MHRYRDDPRLKPPAVQTGTSAVLYPSGGCEAHQYVSEDVRACVEAYRERLRQCVSSVVSQPRQRECWTVYDFRSLIKFTGTSYYAGSL